MRKDLIKKEHFFFGSRRIAFLIFNKTHSNVFVTLVDYKMKVIVCKTSGACNVGSTKKRKGRRRLLKVLLKN